MEGLSHFEHAVLNKLLAGDHPTLLGLRVQADTARLISREYTGAGFFLSFEVPADVPALTTPRDFHLDDVHGKVDALKHGVGFVLFVRKGRLNLLEGYTYGEDWPQDIQGYELKYEHEPRQVNIPQAST
jgi:hypothetical protein